MTKKTEILYTVVYAEDSIDSGVVVMEAQTKREVSDILANASDENNWEDGLLDANDYIFIHDGEKRVTFIRTNEWEPE